MELVKIVLQIIKTILKSLNKRLVKHNNIMSNIKEDLIKIQESTFTNKEKVLMIILYFEYDLSFSLSGNGWLENDDETQNIVDGDDKGLLEKMRKLIQ